MIQKYKRKPIIIDAIQYTGSNVREICDFVNKVIQEHLPTTDNSYLIIQDTYRNIIVNRYDYIVKTNDEMIYVYNNNVFENIYEKIDEL